MRILMLSLDQKIFDPNTSAHKRMKEYEPYVDELVICIPSKIKEEVVIAKNIKAVSAAGSSKIKQFFNILNLSKKIAHDKKIDCITSQDPFFTGLIGWWIAWRTKTAFNVQIHGVFFNNEFWLRESYANRLRGMLARFIVRRAHSVRAVSNVVREGLMELGIPKERVVVVPAFVDIDEIGMKKGSLNIRERYRNYKTIFLTVSRLEPVKNLPMLVLAFTDVIKKYPDTLLLIVGEGSQDQELQDLVGSLGLDNNIKFETWTDDTISYYKVADCLLFPSLHESFGMVPLEALASGCPVISFKTGWIDSRACVLKGIHCISENIPEVWAQKMQEFIEHPDKISDYKHTAHIVYPYTKKTNLTAQQQSWRLAVKNNSSYRLLFLTQKIHDQDDDLAFFIKWVDGFADLGADVKVVCLEKQSFDDHFSVYSLGKEDGVGKFGRLWQFYKYIFTLKYDRVFVHMNPEYMTLGGWYWWFMDKHSYLWYTHYTMHIHLWFAHLFCKRLFAATPQSMPMYENDPKRIITGHGVPVQFWKDSADTVPDDKKRPITDMLAVHRLCRSKRLDITIKALKFLPKEYNLTVYGRDVEKDYVEELHELVKKENLEQRVTFKGPVPMPELRALYPHFQLFPNMAWETIDKTMLEAMLNGLYPVTTKRNSDAIGLPNAPAEETPESVAEFILNYENYKLSKKELQDIVEKKHSLGALVKKMNYYVSKGK